MESSHYTPTIKVEFTFTKQDLNDVLCDLKLILDDPEQELEKATEDLIKALVSAQHTIGGFGGN